MFKAYERAELSQDPSLTTQATLKEQLTMQGYVAQDLIEHARTDEPIPKRLFDEMYIRGLRLLIELHKKLASSV